MSAAVEALRAISTSAITVRTLASTTSCWTIRSRLDSLRMSRHSDLLLRSLRRNWGTRWVPTPRHTIARAPASTSTAT
eukprot:4465132-Prymnesium_polylepis.2